ncbi:AraC family transcriptional regulator [Rubrivivax albus]|uniref:AraC family transcriptional regulator n=1 Tax=Rubrivivax albus TaxID=2499835 RepID=A0A3S2WVH0_9BURK|nr:AraC family transcriptional regulator [Rubrivivax albus]RVT52226.1 AraC family transcriptional regulator [Rubrivivax albus]
MLPRPDRLSALLRRFELRAEVFLAGPVCGHHLLDTPSAELHVLRAGQVVLADASGPPVTVDAPAAVFYPRPLAHQLRADASADLVCAHVRFGTGDDNPLLRHLPPRLVVPLADLPALDATLHLLFDEATARRCGHANVVDRLAEVLMVQLLRHVIATRLVDGGLVAGLSDERLARALAAVHADPAHGWTLTRMAAAAGMSRARFAERFTTTVGLPPGEYLTQWRLGLARTLLQRGEPVKRVAAEVGYGSASALARVFRQRLGTTPLQAAG